MTRVAITRAADRAAALIDGLRAHGIEGLALTVTEVAWFHPDNTPDVSRADVVAFTSVNAVRALAHLLQVQDLSLRAGARFVAVGAATAAAVEAQFGPVWLTSAEGTGADLARTLQQQPDWQSGTTILWPCAATVAGGFAEEMQAAGAELIRLPLYKTVARDLAAIRADVDAAGPFDAVLFAAPSQVRAWAQALATPWTWRAIAIGPTTETALHKHGAQDIVTAPHPDTDGMIAAVLEATGLRNAPSSLEEGQATR